MNLKVIYMAIVLLFVTSASSTYMYQCAETPMEASIIVTSFEEATFSVVNGDNGWAHFEEGVLIIDLNGEAMGRRETRLFGSENDPIFQLLNGRPENMTVNLNLTSHNVPDKATVTIYVKPSSSPRKSFKIKKDTAEGVLGSFTLEASGSANFWLKIKTNGAPVSDVVIDLKLEGTLNGIPYIKILSFKITFEIK